MKKIILAVLLLAVACALLASCASNNTPESTRLSQQLSFGNIPYGMLHWDDYAFPFPKPSATRFAMECDGAKALYCYGMDERDTEAFKNALINDG